MKSVQHTTREGGNIEPLEYERQPDHPGRFRVQRVDHAFLLELVPRSAKRQIPAIIGALILVAAFLAFITHERLSPSSNFVPSIKMVVFAWIFGPLAAISLPYLMTLSDRQRLSLQVDRSGLVVVRTFMGQPERKHYRYDQILALGIDASNREAISIVTKLGGREEVPVARKAQVVREIAEMIATEMRRHHPVELIGF